MYEPDKILLDNELDLLLAHERTMKLGQMAGLSPVTQTSFATAVSEISRDAIEHGVDAYLTLDIIPEQPEHYLVAIIKDDRNPIIRQKTKIVTLVSHLVDYCRVLESGQGSEVRLYVRFPKNQRVNDTQTEWWKSRSNLNPLNHQYSDFSNQDSQLLQLTERLRISEKRYRVLTNSLPLMICTLTSDGKIISANKWLRDYTGASVISLNETKWETIIHEDDFSILREKWMENATVGNVFQTEVRIKNAETGNYIWHLVTSTALHDEKNKILFWSGFFFDIHARKTVEQTLKDNQDLIEVKQELEKNQHDLKKKIDELHLRNQELAEFAYVASHDLQKPLRKIQTFATLLIKQFVTDLNPVAHDLIQRMQKSAGQMHALIEDLLPYYRLNTHQQSFKPVDLKVLIEEVLDNLKIDIQEKEARIDIVPLPTVNGNPLQLRQMFQNLLANALTFRSPDRPPRIRIYTYEVNIFEIPAPMLHHESLYFAISVEDNGIGFDERYHDRIFQLFQRLHSKDQYAGTGIGLAFCKRVAEMHGGTIAAKSQPNQGSTFTVYLPLSLGATNAVSGAKYQHPEGGIFYE